MKKIVITKLKNVISAVLFETQNGCEKAVDVRLINEEEPSLIGNIYIGHVRDVVKNIEAAFVEISKHQMAYLPLKQTVPVFINGKDTDNVCEGDNLIVQISKDAIKTKDAVLTTAFSLTGRYVVLTHGKWGVTFSAKIKNPHYKEEFARKIKERFPELCNAPYGLLIRTEAYQAEDVLIFKEAEGLMAQYGELVMRAKTRQKYYVLKKGESEILSFVNSQLKTCPDLAIVTDSGELLEEIMPLKDNYSNITVSFYEDELLPLYKLYRFEHIFEELYGKRVWLKSGAYLVIEYTEALTVIDVNTGKCEHGKNKEQTFLKINKEAMTEIARQIRMRNVSGMILVDFIDMAEEAHTRELMEFARDVVKQDPVKTTVVDVTKLHLMEITRKKTTDRLPYIENLFTMKVPDSSRE